HRRRPIIDMPDRPGVPGDLCQRGRLGVGPGLLRIMEGLRQLFGPSGALARSLRGFVPRSGQQRMAERIAEALQLRPVVLIEAGTGAGKTFAYLVPALLS